jgi:hypothetical protein
MATTIVIWNKVFSNPRRVRWIESELKTAGRVPELA